MGRPRRIGVVTTSFPRWRGDPAGAFVHGLAAALVRRGHEVEVVVPEPRERAAWVKDEPWLCGIRVDAVKYARPRRLEALFFGAGAPDNLARNPGLAALAPFAVAALWAAVRRRAPTWDAVVSEWLIPSGLVVGALGAVRPSHLAIAHSGDVHLLGRLPFAGSIAAHIADRAERIGCVAEAVRAELVEILGPRRARRCNEKLVLVPMGIDPAALASPREREAVRKEIGIDGFAILFLGRLVPIKGADVLLDAVGASARATVIIAGEGPMRSDLERRARERGVAARFLGAVDEPRRAELLAACDAVAVPSRVLSDGRHEGMPLVVLEAMCAGAPVVASDSGGIREIVRDGETGLLVPADSATALAKAIERLRADPSLRIGLAAGGRRVAASRTWDAVVPTIEEALGVAGAASGVGGLTGAGPTL
jgi:glycosyltransferase involved in cell wall biosynthesis